MAGIRLVVVATYGCATAGIFTQFPFNLFDLRIPTLIKSFKTDEELFDGAKIDFFLIFELKFEDLRQVERF